MYAGAVPVWAGVTVLVVDVVTAVVAWVLLSGAARSVLEPAKSKAVSRVAAAALVGWLLAAFFVTAVVRPGIDLWGVAAVIGWISALVVVGYGLRFFSESYRLTIDAIPHQWLLAFQSYRLVGAIFLPLMAVGVLPAFFAWPAGVGDIIAGAAALGAAYLWARRARGAWGAAVGTNLIGLLDFVVAVGAGTTILAGPLQAVFGAATVSTVVLPVFPIGMIPTFVIPLGLIVHLHSLTRLAGERTLKASDTVPQPVTATTEPLAGEVAK